MSLTGKELQIVKEYVRLFQIKQQIENMSVEIQKLTLLEEKLDKDLINVLTNNTLNFKKIEKELKKLNINLKIENKYALF